MENIGACGKKNQTSFLSKMLHVINTSCPIYDTYVRHFLSTGEPRANNEMDLMEASVKIYEEKIIKGFYNNSKYSELIHQMVKTFDTWYEQKSQDTKSKIGRYVGVDNDYPYFMDKEN